MVAWDLKSVEFFTKEYRSGRDIRELARIFSLPAPALRSVVSAYERGRIPVSWRQRPQGSLLTSRTQVKRVSQSEADRWMFEMIQSGIKSATLTEDQRVELIKCLLKT